LLRIAVRRWPPALREEQRREWTAELAALRGERRSGLRRLTFALSLAVSPAPADGSGGRGWREMLPGIGERLRPGLGFAVLSLLIMQLLPMRFPFEDQDGSATTIPVSWLLALAVVPACHLAGRRANLPASAGTVGVAGVVTTGAALGYLAYHTVPLLAISSPTGPRAYLAASLVFVASMTALLAGLLRLAVRGRLFAAIRLALPGLPAVVLLSWAAGAGVSPGPFYDGNYVVQFATGRPLDLGLATAEESFVAALFILGALLLAYGFGLAASERVLAVTPPAAPAPPAGPATGPATGPAWTPSRAVSVVGVVAAVVGLAAWAYATSALAPALGRTLPPVDLPPLARMPTEWLDEARWVAVILAALGLRVAVARRRGATLAALVLGGLLLAADAVLARTSLMDGGPMAVAVACALAVASAALARRVAGARVRFAGSEVAAVRRGLAVVAVVAAACGPLLVTNVYPPSTRPQVAGLTAVMGAVPAAFVVLAAFAAAGARRRPVSPTLVGALAVLPAVVVASGGVATTTGIDQDVALLVGAVGAGTLAIGAAALALAGRRPGHGGEPALGGGWFLALGLAPLLLAPAALYAAIVPGILLRTAGGADNPSSLVLSFQPGVLLVVVPVAAALARRLIRDNVRPGGGPVPGASPTVHARRARGTA
jgi:hypothetical protein